MKRSTIKEAQKKLNRILDVKMSKDGIVGPQTTRYVHQFKKMAGMPNNGILDFETVSAINGWYIRLTKTNAFPITSRQFVVFVDAGHGGVDEDEVYRTHGKRAYHPGLELHKGGHYYEGYENRIIAERFIQECTLKGINCIRTYHPIFDTPLSKRANLIKYWLRRGYFGYLHSFHSNAIESQDKQKLLNTTGFQIYTTRGQTLSDKIASFHYENVKAQIGADNWRFMEQKWTDNDVDFEANFTILANTDTKEFDLYGGILEEFGFHSSAKDCAFIIQEETRQKRVAAALTTAIQAKYMFEDLHEKSLSK